VQQGRSSSGVGRAVARYTAMRFLLFAVAFLLARLVVDEPLLAVGVAVVGSAIVSIPLLAPYRQQLNAATAARAERRRAAQEQARGD
jgi:hypothetical protein